MQKGQVQIILIGVLVVAIAAAAGFYLSRSTLRQDSSEQASPKPTPVPVVTSQTPQLTPIPDASREPTGSAASPKPFVADETANWKTYTNKGSGYSISYPNDYALHIDDELVYGGGPVVEIYPINSTWPPYGYSISIAVEKNIKNLSLDQPRQLFGIGPLIQYEQLPINWSVKNTSLGGSPAVRVDHCCGG